MPPREVEANDLRLSCRSLGNKIVTVDIIGELEVHNFPVLRETLQELFHEGFRYFIVGMEQCDFLGTPGVGVLARAFKTIYRAGGRMTLVCTQERILKILRITGLTQVFLTYRSMDEAIADHALNRDSRLWSERRPQPDWEEISGNWLPIRIYLADEHDHQTVEDAVVGLAESMNIEVIYPFDPIIGSWYRELLARIKRSDSLPTFDEQAAGVTRAISNHLVNKGQAEIDSTLADAVAKLATSIGDRDAVIQIGSIFFVQCKCTIAARNLTPAELMHLDRNPALLRDPAEALQHLQELNSAAHPPLTGRPVGG